MFGWLATFGAPSRARTTTAVTRWLEVTPRGLFEGLGQLGSILYVAPRAPAQAPCDRSTLGCVVESADLGSLLATRSVALTSAVTCDGPREWIDCVSEAGETLARIYLLPDTDYLAWDHLFADALDIDAPYHRRPDQDWIRASTARVMSFSRRRMASLTLLSARDVRISPLGRGVARDIAASESVGMPV